MLRGTILLFTILSCAISIIAQEQRFMTSDNVDLYLKVKGKGIPCLYIHGGPDAGSYWMEKFGVKAKKDFDQRSILQFHLKQQKAQRL